MNIIFHEKSKTFHLYNNEISYIMTVLRNGHLGQLYCGKHIRDREDFSHLLEMCDLRSIRGGREGTALRRKETPRGNEG